jgi:hypothetical protein
VKNALESFFARVEEIYSSGYITEERFYYLEQRLVNTPKKILFGLAWLYNIESEIQRKSMVE